MEEQTTSPAPAKTGPQHFDFYTALRALKDGKRITKVEWGTQEIYGCLVDEKVKLFKEEKFFDWIISEADLAGQDWVIL